MKVSIALHTDEPDLDGNQRNAEARYRGYNRAYGVLVFNNDGSAIFQADQVVFPEVQADADAVPYTHFSIGVCEGIDPGKGGAIIIAGPLQSPLLAKTGDVPQLVRLAAGVYADRIATMRADGRMGPEGTD